MGATYTLPHLFMGATYTLPHLFMGATFTIAHHGCHVSLYDFTHGCHVRTSSPYPVLRDGAQRQSLVCTRVIVAEQAG